MGLASPAYINFILCESYTDKKHVCYLQRYQVPVYGYPEAGSQPHGANVNQAPPVAPYIDNSNQVPVAQPYGSYTDPHTAAK